MAPSHPALPLSDATTNVQRILVVEDSELDYDIMIATLARAGRTIVAKRVETQAEMKAALAEESWDAVISDHNLPQFNSGGALATLKASGLDLPFIIVSGDIGEDAAVEAMRNGADDYLIKGRTKRLAAALANAIAAAQGRNERRITEAALATTTAQLRQLALHLESAKEIERDTLARDLHDNVATNLTAATLLLAHLRRQLAVIASDATTKPAASSHEAVSTLAEIESLVTGAVVHCNNLAQGLRPDLLDCGLSAAVEWLVGDFSKRTSIASRFESNCDEVPLDDQSVMAAFRFVEEALDNIHKHAQATRVECIIFVRPNNVTIEVSDNGAGMSVKDLDRTGRFGLIEVRARVASLDGELDISATPGPAAAPQTGTTVMLSLPCNISQPKGAAKNDRGGQND